MRLREFPVSDLPGFLPGCLCQQTGPGCLAWPGGWECCAASSSGWWWPTCCPYRSPLLGGNVHFGYFDFHSLVPASPADPNIKKQGQWCVPVLVVAGLFQSHPPMAFCCWMLTVGVLGGAGELRPVKAYIRLSKLRKLSSWWEAEERLFNG